MSYDKALRKQAIKTVVDSIANRIEEEAFKNDGKIPYGLVAKEVNDAKTIFPNLQITRDHINNTLRRRKKNMQSSLSSIVSPNPTSKPATTKIGRPTGTTDKRKRSECMNVKAAKNEICQIYHDEKKRHKSEHQGIAKKRNFPAGRLDQIIKEVKEKRNIGEDVLISKKFIRKRIENDRITVITPSGPDSPLAAIEPLIVKLILAMAEIREPLTPSRCIPLINDLICDTASQQKLIEFKQKRGIYMDSPTHDIGVIGHGYWQHLRKRYNHVLVGKRG